MWRHQRPSPFQANKSSKSTLVFFAQYKVNIWITSFILGKVMVDSSTHTTVSFTMASYYGIHEFGYLQIRWIFPCWKWLKKATFWANIKLWWKWCGRKELTLFCTEFSAVFSNSNFILPHPIRFFTIFNLLDGTFQFSVIFLKLTSICFFLMFCLSSLCWMRIVNIFWFCLLLMLFCC